MKINCYDIKVLDTGHEFTCKEDEFILEAMKRSGCGPISYGCFGGGCGVCKMKIITGEFYSEKRMSRAHVSEQEQAAGVVLICCVKPRGDMEIEAIET